MPAFNKLYETNLTFASAFGIFYSVISVGGAFFIGSKIFKNQKLLGSIPYNPPKDKTKALLLVLIGFGGCLLANYITVFLRAFGEGLGIYSDYTAMQEPSSTFDVIMIFIGSSLIPPLVEEFALRGVLMQSLRKYGNLFAIVTSAFVFGVCMCIIYLKTKNILTCILAHFINNLLAELFVHIDSGNLIFTNDIFIVLFSILAIVSLYLIIISLRQEWKYIDKR